MRVALALRAVRRYVALDNNALQDLAREQWVLADGHLRKTFTRESHTQAAELALDAAKAADALNHHAEIRIRYRKLTFLLRSNDAGSVSNYDFKLARIIDELAHR